jgi:NTE family protein
MASRDPILVDLALQGGGAHGAFTWGVLDRLLEEDWLRFDGISGTSAGAMNGAVMVDGYAADGPDGARASLETFWRKVSGAVKLSPFQRTPRCAARPLDARLFPGLHRHGSDVAHVLAL